MVGEKPVVEQSTAGFGRSLVFLLPPLAYSFADCRDARSCPSLDLEQALLSVGYAAAGHSQAISIGTARVVSLPRMSMTLTTTVYVPGSS
jgi:hypothetical protein